MQIVELIEAPTLLCQMVDMREDPLLEFQVGRFLEQLRRTQMGDSGRRISLIFCSDIGSDMYICQIIRILVVGLACYGRGCGGNISGISERFFPEMLVVGLEEVLHVINIVVRYAHKVPIWVRCVVEIVRIINNEVFADCFESLCGD